MEDLHFELLFNPLQTELISYVHAIGFSYFIELSMNVYVLRKGYTRASTHAYLHDASLSSWWFTCIPSYKTYAGALFLYLMTDLFYMFLLNTSLYAPT